MQAMSKKILVILGHPQKESLCGSLAEVYAAGAIAAGGEVRTLALGDLAFDLLICDRASVKGGGKQTDRRETKLRRLCFAPLTRVSKWYN